MLEKLLNPKSVALVGASGTPGKLGYLILANLVKSDFEGKVYPINPHEEEIFGIKCFCSIKTLPEVPELVLIAVPAESVEDVVEECGKKLAKNIVIISAGFKEIGGEGIKREERLCSLIKKYNLTLIGPNCLGVMNIHQDLNASFAENLPQKGNIALLSQSGAMAVAITDWARKENIGFSKIISLGNKAGLSENECLEYLEKDAKTEIILMYLESFANGRRFMEISKRVSLKKPIIVLKSGTSVQGATAVASHTGVLSGSDTSASVALKQSGVIRTETIDEFFALARVLSFQNIPKGNKVAVVTNAGGPGVIVTDAIANSPFLELAKLNTKTISLLKFALPPASNTHNPIDVIGDARSDRYKKVLEIICPEKEIDIILTLLTPQVMTEKEATARIIVEGKEKNPTKLFITSFMGGESVEYASEILSEKKIPNFLYPTHAVKALEKIIWLKNWREKQRKRRRAGKKSSKKRLRISLSRGLLPTEETNKILKAYKVNIPAVFVAKTVEEAQKYASKIGYPAALKIESPDIIHKTEAGGVALNLKTKEEIKDAFKKIMISVKKKNPKAVIKGITIQKFFPKGKEFFVGMKRDPIFGPLITFGLGGIYVEILKDISFRIAPVSETEIEEMMAETKSFQFFKGVRGESPLDKKSLIKLIQAISQISEDYPEISELDINPVIVLEKGNFVLDARFLIENK